MKSIGSNIQIIQNNILFILLPIYFKVQLNYNYVPEFMNSSVNIRISFSSIYLFTQTHNMPVGFYFFLDIALWLVGEVIHRCPGRRGRCCQDR